MTVVGPEASHPVGTEERCCFVCEHSSTNPALIGTEDAWRFKPRAQRGWSMKCLNPVSFDRLVFGYNVCGGFAER